MSDVEADSRPGRNPVEDDVSESAVQADQPNVEIDLEAPAQETEEESTEPTGEPEEEDGGSDDDFGSFDEASFDEYQEPETAEFDLAVFQNPQLFDERLDQLMERVLPQQEKPRDTLATLLSEGASSHLTTLLKTPRLHPPNWTRLKIRRSLLINLGVPINLDELVEFLAKSTPATHARRRSISEKDIDWSQFDIPELADLHISGDRKQELMSKTAEILSRIDADNLNNTSELFLQTLSEEALTAKLQLMRDNYSRLVELSSVWRDETADLRKNQEIYEAVVQSMVGYSQKLQRNELLENLGKTKRGKRTF